MTIHRATPGDVRAVALAMRDQDFTEFSATSDVTDRQTLAHNLAVRYGGRDDVLVGCADGEPVCIGGTIEAWPGVVTLLFFATPGFSRIGRGITRWIKRELFPRYIDSGVHRIQAVSHGDHRPAHAWLRSLGLTEEARFVKFGKGGETFVQFAMVK
jgi:hypothetical protein